MAGERIVQIVEIDIDTCSRTWGVSPCMAAFGSGVVRKCYNTFATCQYKQAYNKTVNTLRFIEPSYSVKNGNYIPALVSVGGYAQEVNIAGYASNIGGLGKRASIDITLLDFTDRDTLTDKYWSQRMDGTAQTDEPGYDPITRGTFWTKFKARNPNYAGRPLRVIQAHYDASGALVYDRVRNYVMDSIKGPGNSGRVTITAKDILALADDEKALAPAQNAGRLLEDIDDLVTTATLTPAGIGASEYPASGFATIGSEIVRFTRSGDVLTLTRGQKDTQAAKHNANDTVQVAFNVDRVRADTVIYQLLTQFGNIPTSWINLSEWTAEFDRWGANLYLSATICKPEGVAKLVGEINQLGITVWWDEVSQKIRIKLNHPPSETPDVWSDRNNIISITQEDNDDERATRISLNTVQIDPTKGVSDDNFKRSYLAVFVDGEHPDMYGESRTKTINSRWLNHGADSTAWIIARRLLNRYQIAPITFTVKVDYKDDVALTDVIELQSHVATNETGAETPILTQVFYRKDDRAGSDLTVYLQRFQFNARYGVITENSRPNYNASSEAQKLKGSYFVGPSLVFADGRGPYQFV